MFLNLDEPVTVKIDRGRPWYIAKIMHSNDSWLRSRALHGSLPCIILRYVTIPNDLFSLDHHTIWWKTVIVDAQCSIFRNKTRWAFLFGKRNPQHCGVLITFHKEEDERWEQASSTVKYIFFRIIKKQKKALKHKILFTVDMLRFFNHYKNWQ